MLFEQVGGDLGVEDHAHVMHDVVQAEDDVQAGDAGGKSFQGVRRDGIDAYALAYPSREYLIGIAGDALGQGRGS